MGTSDRQKRTSGSAVLAGHEATASATRLTGAGATLGIPSEAGVDRRSRSSGQNSIANGTDGAGGGVAVAGGRGGPVEITDVSKKGNDLVLKFKQQGRGGEVDVVMTLAMQADGTLKVSQELGGNTQSGTGKKKT